MLVKAIVAIGVMLLMAGCRSSDGEPSYTDPASHESAFVTVDAGVRLHYLDFGGTGDVLLFLAGAGDTAHVFDQFAPLFTDEFHVIALTRRGFGESSQPASGYDTQTLANDIQQFLDKLGISRVSIAGHSIAGAEMTRFALDHPEQVIKLVYLDAAFDWASSTQSANLEKQPGPPAPTSDQLASPGAFATYVAWTNGVPEFPEAEIRATNRFDKKGTYKGSVTPSNISLALATSTAAEHPDYAGLTAPILAIYTVPDSVTGMFPWLTEDSPERSEANAFFPAAAASLADQRAAFVAQAPDAVVIEMHQVPHFLFLAQPAEVASNMRSFLAP
jgi:pimeloyl-ACP methyl ester carboxylesterase